MFSFVFVRLLLPLSWNTPAFVPLFQLPPQFGIRSSLPPLCKRQAFLSWPPAVHVSFVSGIFSPHLFVID